MTPPFRPKALASQGDATPAEPHGEKVGPRQGRLLLFPAKSVPKTSVRSHDAVNGGEPRLLSVKALAARYGITKAAIYGFIKTDPTFPYANVGLKKKFVIDVAHFETWLTRRTDKEKHEHFATPSTADLLAVFKRGDKT